MCWLTVVLLEKCAVFPTRARESFSCCASPPLVLLVCSCEVYCCAPALGVVGLSFWFAVGAFDLIVLRFGTWFVRDFHLGGALGLIDPGFCFDWAVLLVRLVRVFYWLLCCWIWSVRDLHFSGPCSWFGWPGLLRWFCCALGLISPRFCFDRAALLVWLLRAFHLIGLRSWIGSPRFSFDWAALLYWLLRAFGLIGLRSWFDCLRFYLILLRGWIWLLHGFDLIGPRSWFDCPACFYWAALLVLIWSSRLIWLGAAL